MALFIFLKGVMLTLSSKMTVFNGVRAACLDPMCDSFGKSVFWTLAKRNADFADSKEKICVCLRSSASNKGNR
jgi:hypothetical protein